MQPKFPLGQVVMTRGVADTIEVSDVLAALARHSCGDWGEVCQEDARENEYSLKKGFRLLSVYRTNDGTTFWILTKPRQGSLYIYLTYPLD